MEKLQKFEKHNSRKLSIAIICLFVGSAILFSLDYLKKHAVAYAMTTNAQTELIETGLNMNLVIFLALTFFFGFLFLVVLIKWH